MLGFRKNSAISVLALLCAALFNARAEAGTLPLPDHARYAIEHFGERFGLGAATITALAQDQQGFLWIGTETGLFRYDGAEATHFGRAEGLPGEFVEMILAAPDGNLWVRTRKGISRFSHEKFTNISMPEEAGALRDVYQSFAVDSAGTLFVSTQHGFFRIGSNGVKSRLSEMGEASSLDTVDTIVRAPDDTIWFTSKGKIGFLSRGSLHPQTFSPLPIGGDHVFALLPTADHQLWVRTGHQVGILNTRRPGLALVWVGQGLPTANTMGGPSLDHHGNLLLPTYRGLYQRVGKEWKIIDRQSGLTSSAVASVLEDREGGIWIGTAGAGLDHWPGSKQWSGWTDAEGLPDALVLGVVRDRRFRLWVATNTALALWDPQKHRWQSWTANGLAGAGISQLVLAPDGAVWGLFPGKGVFRFDADSLHPRAERAPTGATWQPRHIVVAPDGVVWADGNDMLHTIRYLGGRFFIREQAVPGRQAGTTQTPSMSMNGVLWTAGPKGLSRWANGRWQHFETADGLLSNNIVNLRAVKDDEAWVGYPDEGAITHVTISADGRPLTRHFPKAMCSMGTDVTQNIWLEMQEGVGVVSPQGVLTTFNQSDGLLWDDLNCGAMWQESDGSILLGTSKGLARYDPTQESQNLPQPTVVLTSAVFGKTDRLGDGNPQIEYADRTFVAHFAAPVLHDPDHVSCRYRLNGLETDFTVTTLREARYTSLPAGAYSFEVSCGSPQLGWSAVASYPFLIQPPWWQTRWAQFLFAVLLACLIYGIVQYRTRRVRRETERLELAVAERSAELANANRELQEVSLRDPLTGVRNRRFFETTIAADASQAIRAHNASLSGYSWNHRDLVFYLVDIDHFKEVNDRYGHQAGDRLLVEISGRLSSIVRQSDFLIRWGGEEFLVVCRSAERQDAPRMAERILSAIGSTEFTLGNGRALRRTCSVGWAPFPWLPPSRADLSAEEVLRLADHALYLSKHRGRNQSTGILPSADVPSGPRYSKLEELVEAALIREIRTPGQIAVTPTFPAEGTMTKKG